MLFQESTKTKKFPKNMKFEGIDTDQSKLDNENITNNLNDNIIKYYVNDEASIYEAFESIKSKFYTTNTTNKNNTPENYFYYFKNGIDLLLKYFFGNISVINAIEGIEKIEIQNNEKKIYLKNSNEKEKIFWDALLTHIFYDYFFLEKQLNNSFIIESINFENEQEISKMDDFLKSILFEKLNLNFLDLDTKSFLEFCYDIFINNDLKSAFFKKISQLIIFIFYAINNENNNVNDNLDYMIKNPSNFWTNKKMEKNTIKNYIASENLVYYFCSVFLEKNELGENALGCCDVEDLILFLKQNFGNIENKDNEKITILENFYEQFKNSFLKILNENGIQENNIIKRESEVYLTTKKLETKQVIEKITKNNYYYFGISVKLNTDRIGGVIYFPVTDYTSKNITSDVSLILKLGNGLQNTNYFNDEYEKYEKFREYILNKYQTSQKYQNIINALINKNNVKNKNVKIPKKDLSVITNILIRKSFFEDIIDIDYNQGNFSFSLNQQILNNLTNSNIPPAFFKISNETDFQTYLNIFYEMFYYTTIGDKNYIKKVFLPDQNNNKIVDFKIVKLLIDTNNYNNSFQFDDPIIKLKNFVFNNQLNQNTKNETNIELYCALNIQDNENNPNNLLIIRKLNNDSNSLYKIFSHKSKGNSLNKIDLKKIFTTGENGKKFNIIKKENKNDSENDYDYIFLDDNVTNILTILNGSVFTLMYKFTIYIGDNKFFNYVERKIGFSKNRIYFQSHVNDNINEEFYKNKLMSEGGNALKFAGAERLDASLLEENFEIIKNNILSVLPVAQEDVIPIGSTFKKFTDYGDIDILLDTYGVHAETNFKGDSLLEYIKSRLSLVFPQVQKVTDFCILTLLSPIQGRVSEYVQVDILPSNLYPKIDSREKDIEYMLFAFASPIEGQSKYKGAHRNILIQSLCDCITYNNNPIEFNPNLGLIVYNLDSPYCIRNVDLIIKILFKSEYNKEQLNSFEEVYIAIKRVYKDILDKIMQRFFERVSENKELLSYFQKDK